MQGDDGVEIGYFRTRVHVLASSVAEPLTHSTIRGMPRWREKQRNLPVGEKVALLGQVILETRKLEAFKKACKPSATFSKDS